MSIPLTHGQITSNAYETLEHLRLADEEPDSFYKKAFDTLDNEGDRELNELLNPEWEASYKKIDREFLDEYMGVITGSFPEEAVLKQRKGDSVDLVRNSNAQQHLEMNKYNLKINKTDVSNNRNNFSRQISQFRNFNEGAVLEALKNIA